MYKSGTFLREFSRYSGTQQGIFTKTSTYFRVGVTVGSNQKVYISSNSPVDITMYSKLNVEVLSDVGAGSEWDRQVGIGLSREKFTRSVGLGMNPITRKTIYSVDVSNLSGDFYVIIYVQENDYGRSHYFDIYNLWFES